MLQESYSTFRDLKVELHKHKVLPAPLSEPPRRSVIALRPQAQPTCRAVMGVVDPSRGRTESLLVGSARLCTVVLFRFDPGVGSRHLDSHIWNEDMQRLAVGGAAVLG